MVPMGLAPPAAANVQAAASDPFAGLLPDGLAALEGDDSQPRSASAFPVPQGLGQFDEDVEEDDVTEDILEDNDDFDFSEITSGIEGAQELLNGNRRLQAIDGVEDVSNLMFGSANLAL